MEPKLERFKEEVIKMFKRGDKTSEIAKRFSVLNECVRTNLIKWGADHKRPVIKNTHEWDFFSRMDQISCYWAGFIAADGCVSLKRKNNRAYPTLVITIHKQDRILLERFKQDIKYSGKIWNAQSNKISIQLTRFDKGMKDLDTIFNIRPRKTYDLPAPNLTDPNLIRAYIAGYIDGDGCLRYRPNGNREIFMLDIMARQTLLVWIKKFFSEICPEGERQNTFYSYGEVSSYRISGKRAMAIAMYLKASPVNKLERKWNKVMGIGSRSPLSVA